MAIGRKPARAFVFIPLALLLFMLGAVARPNVALAAQADANGRATQMPAFYEDMQVTVNMKEQPGGASRALIAHNGSINTIYASNDLDETQVFPPVINAIQGEGFNPLWRQVLIIFNAGSPPPGFTGFTSEEDVLAAAAGPNPEITLDVTDEVYRCSVVAPSPRPS